MRDLSLVEHSSTKIIQDNYDEIMSQTSVAGIYETVKSLFANEKLDTPATRRLLLNIQKQKSPVGALQVVVNSLLCGSNLSVK